MAVPPIRAGRESGVGSHVAPRRQVLGWIAGGIGAVVVAGVAGVEMISHGVLPGKEVLDEIDGACSVATPAMTFGPLGPTFSSSFYSSARRRSVGYTFAYPPGDGPGDDLALIVMLHGFGNSHRSALFGMTPAQAVALKTNGKIMAPMAMVTVDGGDGYWNPHPGDDPLGMVVNELIPFCQKKGLGAPPHQIGMMAVSMGGYGALGIAEKVPGLVSAVAAISPAIWSSYDQAHAANAGAFASASAFAKGDVIRHAAKLREIPLRVASGSDDPFHPGVEKLISVLPAGSTVVVSPGCHTEPFFYEQEPPSLEFLAQHLT